MVKTFFVSFLFIRNQCYLVHRDGAGILVDPAWQYDLIEEFLLSEGVALKAILLTHSHVDHTHLAGRLAQQYGVPVFMGREEISYYKWDCPNLIGVDHLQPLSIGGFTVMPIHTPGHTAGSMCYLVEGHLFSGDTVFMEGVGICTGRGADVERMYDSVQFLKGYLPAETLFWPGHSFGKPPGQDLAYLLQNNIYLQLGRHRFVEFRMRKNKPSPYDFK
jgi:glyoxylase-like metal-dependent hydrolase (beta-lactamase superfamily II)